ncbi:MAG: hypothetical protein AAFW68_11700, partial [Pseudomonadota bacterium]
AVALNGSPGDPKSAAIVTDAGRPSLRTASATIAALFGSPGDPLSATAHFQKFKDCIAFGFGQPKPALCERLINAVDQLETRPNAAELSRLAAGLEEK